MVGGGEKTSKGFQSDDVSFRARSRKPPSFPILYLKGLDFASDVTDSYVKARIFQPLMLILLGTILRVRTPQPHF